MSFSRSLSLLALEAACGKVATGRHATEPPEVHASHSRASPTGGGAGPADSAKAIRIERR